MTHPAVQRTRALDRLMTDALQIGKAVARWRRRVARNRDRDPKYTDAHPVTGERCGPRARYRGNRTLCMLAYMQRTTVKLPDELDARLRHEAKRRGSTVSELTREAIENLLGAQHGKRRLLAAGAGASGSNDISERIEEILANEVQPSH